MKALAAMLLPQFPGEPISELGASQFSSLLIASHASAQPAEVQI